MGMLELSGGQCGGLIDNCGKRIIPYNKLLVLLSLFGEKWCCDIQGCEDCHRLKAVNPEDLVCATYAKL